MWSNRVTMPAFAMRDLGKTTKIREVLIASDTDEIRSSQFPDAHLQGVPQGCVAL
jgi:hypothetical protein